MWREGEGVVGCFYSHADEMSLRRGVGKVCRVEREDWDGIGVFCGVIWVGVGRRMGVEFKLG